MEEKNSRISTAQRSERNAESLLSDFRARMGSIRDTTGQEKPRVAAIVPAYNEEPTIGEIVRTLVSFSDIDEVIVVANGSTDRTAEVARAAGATKVDVMPAEGKGEAMQHGLTHTDAPIIFFLDADLRGLTAEHLRAVLAPVLSGQKVMNAALRDRGPFLTKLSAYLPLIGGERALHRSVFERVNPRYLHGFMVEIAMNYSCRSRHLPYGSTPLPGLTIRRKMEKVGFLVGLWQYIKMFTTVFYAMVAVRWARLTGKFLS
ncbi:MAG: glycosyltransferase [Patescibacteria group bacterium]